jgi:hypothetical protein
LLMSFFLLRYYLTTWMGLQKITADLQSNDFHEPTTELSLQLKDINPINLKWSEQSSLISTLPHVHSFEIEISGNRKILRVNSWESFSNRSFWWRSSWLMLIISTIVADSIGNDIFLFLLSSDLIMSYGRIWNNKFSFYLFSSSTPLFPATFFVWPFHITANVATERVLVIRPSGIKGNNTQVSSSFQQITPTWEANPVCPTARISFFRITADFLQFQNSRGI